MLKQGERTVNRKVNAFVAFFTLLAFTQAGVAGGDDDRRRDRKKGERRHDTTTEVAIDNRDTTLIGVANDIETTNVNVFAPTDNRETTVTASGGTGIGGQGGAGGSATSNATGGNLTIGNGALSPNATATGGNAVIEGGAVKQEQAQFQDQLQQQSQQQTALNHQNTSIVFEATKPLAGVLHVGVPESPTVIQYEISRGAEERNLDAHAAYQDTCRPEHTWDNPIRTEELKEGKVVWEFQNHHNFTGTQGMGPSTRISMVLPKREDNPTTEEDESAVRVDCLGTILAKTVDRKHSPGIGTLEDDVYAFATYTFGQCRTSLYLFSPEGATGANRGLQARSFAGNVLGSLTDIVGGDGTGGTGGGWNGGRSNSFGAVQVGTTYWVLCANPNGPVEMVSKEPTPEPQPEPTPIVEPPKDAATTPPPERATDDPRRRVYQRGAVQPSLQ